MLLAILVFQAVLLLVFAVLLLRARRPAEQDASAQQLGRLEAWLRESLGQLRQETPAEAARGRQESARSAAELRQEVVGSIAALGEALKGGLDSLRHDQGQAAAALRSEVDLKMRSIAQGFADLRQETELKHGLLKDSLNQRLAELMGSNTSHQDKLREAVQARLDFLARSNSDKLEEMRATVDEKLHATLHSRLTESFGQVTDQLNKVHTGLGEMSKLSEGVDDLARIFTNVKSRGGFGEAHLDMLLQQILPSSGYVRNAICKPGSREMVEFAVRFPGHGGSARLLPIDSKFPREVWERLEAAYETNDQAQIASAGREFEATIRAEGKKICSKYINPPVTTPHAIMFLPTEGLYAEVMRRDALQAEIQSKCQVTIAGPSTMSAILTSFQMGFHMIALQDKGDEVWKVLESAKTEFGKFGTLMDRVEGDVTRIQKTLGDVGVRTRAINRTLREVSLPAEAAALPFEPAGSLRLVASGEE